MSHDDNQLVIGLKVFKQLLCIKVSIGTVMTTIALDMRSKALRCDFETLRCMLSKASVAYGRWVTCGRGGGWCPRTHRRTGPLSQHTRPNLEALINTSPPRPDHHPTSWQNLFARYCLELLCVSLYEPYHIKDGHHSLCVWVSVSFSGNTLALVFAAHVGTIVCRSSHSQTWVLNSKA
jgi:hypothetical protein